MAAIDATTIPAIPVDVTALGSGAGAASAPGFNEVYFLYTLLNSIQPSSGQAWILAAYHADIAGLLLPYVQTDAPRNPTIQAQIAVIAPTIVGDLAKLTGGSPIPTILDVLSASGIISSNAGAVAGALDQYLSIQNNASGGSDSTVQYPAGSKATSVTTIYNGPNGTGGLASEDQENSDGTSQITGYHPDGSTTTTVYAGPKGTGPVTKIYQENANGTSQISVNGPNGSSTITTYAGLGGTGTVTSTATSQVDTTYSYGGGLFSGYISFSVPESAVYSGSVSAWSFTNGFYTLSSSDSGSLTYLLGFLTGPSIPAYWPDGWSVSALGHPSNAGGSLVTFDSASQTGLNNASDTILVGSKVVAAGAAGAWSGGRTTAAVTISPSVGQTQQLATVLSNPSLTAQGPVQDLTINGPGIVAVTGVASVAGVTVNNGASLVLQGGTLNTDPITVGTGGKVSGYGTITGSETVNGTIAATGQSLDITGNVSGGGTLTVASGAALDFGTTGANTPVPVAGSIADVVNDGVFGIENGGSSLDVTSAVDPSSSGYFLLTSQSTLEIAAYLGTGLKIQFIGSSNKLTVDNTANFGLNVGSASYAGPQLLGFGATDSIDLKGIAPTGLGLNYSAATGDLQITGSGGSALATLAFQNSALGAGTFHAASDGAGGTLITHS
jgi:hypothetical protein